MKTKLLSAMLLISCIGYSQTPIANFYGADQVVYILAEPTTTLDQSATGANINWNYSFNFVGASYHYNGILTGEEMTSYPGSTYKEGIIWTPDAGPITESSIYSKHPSELVSLTAFKNADLELNSNTNNALIGQFPMNYGYTNSDPIAGTYKYGTYTGTFTGTAVTTVDAYGTLTANIGNIPANSSVTRLKIVQSISLNYFPLTNIGTASQTTYLYYGYAGVSFPVQLPLMRTTNTVISVALLSIDSDTTTVEVFDNLLATNQFLAQDQLKIQNPVEDFLNIKANDNVTLQSATINDMSGRVVLQGNLSENVLNVSSLQKGIYTLTIFTDQGKLTQKIIKK